METDTKTLLDNEEFQAFQNGSPSVMDKLFKAYCKSIYLYAFKILDNHQDAEDMTAEAMAILWKERENMKDLRHIRNFLYLVTKNRSIELLRLRDRRSHHLTEQMNELSTAEEVGGIYDRMDAAVQAQLMETMVKKVDSLAPKRRTVLLAYIFLSMSVKEIAAALGISKKTVYAHKAEGIREIQESLDASR